MLSLQALWRSGMRSLALSPAALLLCLAADAVASPSEKTRMFQVREIDIPPDGILVLHRGFTEEKVVDGSRILTWRSREIGRLNANRVRHGERIQRESEVLEVNVIVVIECLETFGSKGGGCKKGAISCLVAARETDLPLGFGFATTPGLFIRVSKCMPSDAGSSG